MSRIGRLPVVIPQGVEVTVSPENLVTVKGPKGTLKRQIDKAITVKVENGHVVCTRSSEEKEIKSMHGLYRKLIFNMVEGVTKGFQKGLVVNGVGYRVVKQGNKVVLSIGYSHNIEVAEIEGITLEVPSEKDIVVKGIDNEKVGQFAANIRSLRKPDPYHAYGIRYSDEVIARKEGKKGTK